MAVEKRETLNVPQRGETWVLKEDPASALLAVLVVDYHAVSKTVICVQNSPYSIQSLHLGHFCEKYISEDPLQRGPLFKGHNAEEWWAAYVKQGHEIEQILGKALGYPPLFPIVSQVDDGMVCVGEHVPETVAAEAAERIAKLQNDNKVFTDMLAAIYAPVLNPMMAALKNFLAVFNEHGAELLAEMEKQKNAG